ncbi:hypothetical protein TorRG33x02_320440 [Trema orientale]|uniref:Uncharacterized protein n=1 Tax=Trema orientale TaxID=63057 RepID=A0A2P5BI23_TREOI|nr:hypothetical protein TorRG33x02_320440 [Trema orientale]
MGWKLLSELLSSIIIHFFKGGAAAFTHFCPTWPLLSLFLKMSAMRLDLTCRVYPELDSMAMDMDMIDHFDRLPDSRLLLVFNKIGEVKALCGCCVVLLQ